MKTNSILFNVLVTFVLTSSCYGEEPWEAVKEVDGIQVFTREVPGTPLVEVRGEALIDETLEKVSWVLMDCERGHEWVQNLEQCKVVKSTSDFDKVTYNHFGTPVVIKDRDFVTSVKTTVHPNKMSIFHEIKSVEIPEAPPTKYVRGEVILSTYSLTQVEPKKIKLVAQALVDPKGTVPKWIVNFFQKRWPVKSIQLLRKQVAKSDIQVPGFLIEALAKTKSDPVPSSKSAVSKPKQR